MDPSGPDSAHDAATPEAATRPVPALVLAALALVLATATIVEMVRWQTGRAEMLHGLREAGVAEDRPELLRQVRYERSLEAARVTVARVLVFRVLEIDATTADSEEVRRRIAALPRAEELARATLSAQPNDWQAQMLLGASIWLRRFYERDPRLVAEYRQWEAPLLSAIEAAPDQLEPRRLLAAAYLEVWLNLSEAKRNEARTLMTGLFADDLRSFGMLLPTWLAVERDLERALEVVPPEPEAWLTLRRLFADRKSWTSFVLVHERYLSALEADFQERLAEAERRLRFGDYFRSREMFLRVVLDAPTTHRFADPVTRALEIYPPGIHGLGSVGRLRGWLDWSLELAQVGVEGLPPAALGKLVDALGSEVEPEVAAHGAMVAGNVYQAERYSKLVDAFRRAGAAPFLIAKARAELQAGRDDAAAATLDLVQADARVGLAWAQTRRDVSRVVGDVLAEAAAEEQLAELRGPVFGASTWRWRRGRPTLELVASRVVAGVEIAVAEAPDDGAVVDVLLDGRSASVRAVRQGDIVRLQPLPTSAGSHLLEIRFLAGGQVVPGRVRLLDPAD